MKSEFLKSDYSSLWTDQKSFVNFFDYSNVLDKKYNWYTTQFAIDSTATPTSGAGDASFTVTSIKPEASPMADMAAPLSHGKPVDWSAPHKYSGSIPHHIAPAFLENAMERLRKQQEFELIGDDKKYILDWAKRVQYMKDSLDLTLTYMSAQAISTGRVDYKEGRGIKGIVYDAQIPAENIVKGGTAVTDKAWSDESCKLLDQMASLEARFREENGLTDTPMKWQIPYDMFVKVFLTNAQVRQFVIDYRTNNQLATTDNFLITEEIFNEVIQIYPSISPIEIVAERSKNFNGKINGWKEGIAVLRPRGYAGLIKYTNSLDKYLLENFGSTDVKRVITRLDTVKTVINSIKNDGDYLSYHSEMIMDAVPVLNEVPYHLIVDTTQAGTGKATLSFE